MTKLSLLRFDSRAELDAALEGRLRAALMARGASAVMLAGGSTPMPAYRAVARQLGAHDDRLHVLFSDDRYVAADAAASNYFQSRPLLDVLGLPDESLLRVNTQLPLPQAAADENAARDVKRGGIQVEVRQVGDRPAGTTPREARIVRLAEAVIAARGYAPKLEASSTDSNIPISLGIPAVTVASGGRGSTSLSRMPPIAA